VKANLWAAIVFAGGLCVGCAENQPTCASLAEPARLNCYAAQDSCVRMGMPLLAEMDEDKARMDQFAGLCTGNPPCEQDVKLQEAKCDAVTAKIPADLRRTMKDLPDACAEVLRLIDECKATLDDDCDQFTRARDAVKEDLRRVRLSEMAVDSCEQSRQQTAAMQQQTIGVAAQSLENGLGSMQGLADQNQGSAQMLRDQAEQFPRFQPPEPVPPVGAGQGSGSAPLPYPNNLWSPGGPWNP